MSMLLHGRQEKGVFSEWPIITQRECPLVCLREVCSVVHSLLSPTRYLVLSFCSSLSYTCHTILRFIAHNSIFALKQWIPISTISHSDSYQSHYIISRGQGRRKNYGSMRFLHIPTFQFVQ